MATVAEIREQLRRYLVQEQSLNDFNAWLSLNTWNLHRQPVDVRELAGEIELWLAEHSTGHLAATELQNKLYPLLETQSLTVGQFPIRTSANSTVVWPPKVAAAA